MDWRSRCKKKNYALPLPTDHGGGAPPGAACRSHQAVMGAASRSSEALGGTHVHDPAWARARTCRHGAESPNPKGTDCARCGCAQSSRHPLVIRCARLSLDGCAARQGISPIMSASCSRRGTPHSRSSCSTSGGAPRARLSDSDPRRALHRTLAPWGGLRRLSISTEPSAPLRRTPSQLRGGGAPDRHVTVLS